MWTREYLCYHEKSGFPRLYPTFSLRVGYNQELLYLPQLLGWKSGRVGIVLNFSWLCLNIKVNWPKSIRKSWGKSWLSPISVPKVEDSDLKSQIGEIFSSRPEFYQDCIPPRDISPMVAGEPKLFMSTLFVHGHNSDGIIVLGFYQSWKPKLIVKN